MGVCGRKSPARLPDSKEVLNKGSLWGRHQKSWIEDGEEGDYKDVANTHKSRVRLEHNDLE